MSKLLAIPFPVLQTLHNVAKRIDPSVVHLTYPIIRQIITHIDQSREDLARSLLITKTRWGRERAEGFLSECKNEAKDYLCLLHAMTLKKNKQELCQQFINRLKTRRDLCREQIRANMDAQIVPTFRFFTVGSSTMFGGSEDLDFSSFAEEEILTHAELRAKEQEYLEI